MICLAAPAEAKPPAPALFCKLYPDSKTCEAGPPPCTLCHSIAPARNVFGAQIALHLAVGAPRPLSNEAFSAALPAALKAVEKDDADGDGVSNIDEIMAGSLPWDANSKPVVAACSPAEKEAAAKGRWNVCGYDPVYAFKRVRMDFCGASPTRAELAGFSKLAGDRMQWEPALSDALDTCLKSRYWLGKDGVVWNLANPKIKPVDSVKSGPDAGPVPLADYYFDYNLFTWINSGDRDVRDLLLAQYFVKRVSDSPPTLRLMSEEELKAVPMGQGQNVEQAKRVGMLTTRWFTTVNTMFTAIPRTTAAQAYRAYLGFDIAHMEGLHPVEGEPREYDHKGVTTPTCAACHSTLDPLTYPFTRYNGIFANNYMPNRLNAFVRVDTADVLKAPEKGMIFGHEVSDLLEFGKVAANSEEFARKVTLDYWKLLIGRVPNGLDQREYSALWRGLMDPNRSNYRVEKMLHALILTEAYGKP
jgi:hypothetical protein